MLETIYNELWNMFFEGTEIYSGLSEQVCYLVSIGLMIVFIGAIFAVAYYAFKMIFDIVSGR